MIAIVKGDECAMANALHRAAERRPARRASLGLISLLALTQPGDMDMLNDVMASTVWAEPRPSYRLRRRYRVGRKWYRRSPLVVVKANVHRRKLRKRRR